MAVCGKAAAFEADARQSDAAAAGAPAADALDDLKTVWPTDWSVLNWHLGAEPSDDAPPERWTTPAPAQDPVATWNRTEHADGSAAVTVNRPLQAPWDSKIGAEFKLAPAPERDPGPADPATLLAGAPTDPSAGAAWASLSTPSFGWGKVGLDARLDAAAGQRKASLSASHGMALGRQFSLTLQSGYAATESSAFGATSPPVEASSDPNVFSTEQVARLAILPTQTKIAAGLVTSTPNAHWLRTLSAEQTLFEGASVVGSISEAAEGPPTGSFVAKFQRHW